MIVCCSSPWHKDQVGRSQTHHGVTFVFNTYVPDADVVVDIKFPCTGLSRRYPPERRVWVHLEPVLLTRYFVGFEQYYAGGILTWQRGLQCLPQWRRYWQGGRGGGMRDTDEGKLFRLTGHISAKNGENFDGYALRRRILQRQDEIRVPSLIYNHRRSWQGEPHDYPRPTTDEAMDAMFYLAIENCRERDYFTEKIVRAFANQTVPVYYGDPDIGEKFDERGIIVIDDDNWLDVINALTPADYFERMESVRCNYFRSREYWTKLDRIAEMLKTTPAASAAAHGDAVLDRAVPRAASDAELVEAREAYVIRRVGEREAMAECNGAAAFIYALCDGARSVSGIASAIASQWGVEDDSDIHADVVDAIRRFARQGVIEFDTPGGQAQVVPTAARGCRVEGPADGYRVVGDGREVALNAPAAKVWSLCTGERTLADVARDIEQALGGGADEKRDREVLRSVLRLADQGLLTTSASDAPGGGSAGLPGAGRYRRKPRVLMLLTRYPQLSETYIKTEIMALRDEYDVKVVAFGDSNMRYANHHPYTVVKVKGDTMTDDVEDESGDLESLAESFRPDVLHTHYLHNVNIVGALSERIGVPFTVRAHSYDVMAREFRHHAGSGRPEPSASLIRAVGWINRPECLGVLTFPYTLAAFRAAGIDEDKLVPCYPVVNFSAFYDRSPNDRGLLNVEPCLPKKAVTDFLDLASMMPDRRFSLYGMGHQIKKVTAYNESIGGPATIHDTVEPEQMPGVYKQHDWLIYTASFKNGNVGWPVAVFEAQAAGLGVCVANVHPHVAEQLGGAGFTYDSVADIPGIVSRPYPREMRELGFDNARKSDVFRQRHLLTDRWAPVLRDLESSHPC